MTTMKIPLCLLLAFSLLASSCNFKDASKSAATAETKETHFPEGSPKFLTSYKAAMDEAKKEGKPVVLVFSAAWCAPCQGMKKTVYPSKEVTPLHDNFVWAYLDFDDEANADVATKYQVEILPHIQFLTSEGQKLGVVSGSTAREFAGTLEVVLVKARMATQPPEPKPESKAEAKPAAVSEAKPTVESEAKPQVTAETKPAAAPEAKPQVIAEAKPAPTPPAVIPDTKPEPKAEAKPTPAPETAPKVEEPAPKGN